jgi:DNA polymerase III subunit epsilon
MELKLHRPIVFFDLETTGLNMVTDRIVEWCILRINPDDSQKMWTQLVNPGMHIPEEVTKIHGITDDDVADKPHFKELAPRLNEFMEGCDLAGYNSIKFDIPFLAEEFLRADIDFDLKNRRFIDVLNMYHKLEPRNLRAAYKFYCEKELIDAHSAEADTLATYDILKSMIDRYENYEYEDKYGRKSTPVVNDVQALHEFSYHSKFADLAGHLVFNDKDAECFNFGKHKGKTVTDVLRDEPSYYDWIMKSEFPLYTKKVLTAIKLRAFNNR